MSALLSSINELSSMMGIMLHLPSLNTDEISEYQDGFDAWQHLNPDSNRPELPELQKRCDSVQIRRLFDGLEFDNEEETARS